MGADDSPALHEADTLAAGAGLCDPTAVRALVEGASEAVAWLLDIGTSFDRDGNALLLGREAAHSRRRVLHAGGDATGAEIERALVDRVVRDPEVTIYERAVAHDLVVEGGRCIGVVADLANNDFRPELIQAPLVVLAAGGMGQLWATTSNPVGATADGLAIALRAGAAVADLEFVQFHPTVLKSPGGGPFLVSEAVRGEGAYLRSRQGQRFMLDAHPLAELAPRDIVARAIQAQIVDDGSDHVMLDLRHLDPVTVRERFPSIGAELRQRGLNLARDVIPVAPAAHYAMGGVVASPTGQTSLPGLLALGEAACTGVHGANRLASNSLLEGLVFGLAAADRIGEDDTPPSSKTAPAELTCSPPAAADHQTVENLRATLQATMSRHVSVVRDATGLHQALLEIDKIDASLTASERLANAELANMVIVARHLVGAALHREESRGGHFRADFPHQNPKLEGCHTLYHPSSDGSWHFGELADVLPVNAHRIA